MLLLSLLTEMHLLYYYIWDFLNLVNHFIYFHHNLVRSSPCLLITNCKSLISRSFSQNCLTFSVKTCLSSEILIVLSCQSWYEILPQFFSYVHNYLQLGLLPKTRSHSSVTLIDSGGWAGIFRRSIISSDWRWSAKVQMFQILNPLRNVCVTVLIGCSSDGQYLQGHVKYVITFLRYHVVAD